MLIYALFIDVIDRNTSLTAQRLWNPTGEVGKLPLKPFMANFGALRTSSEATQPKV